MDEFLQPLAQALAVFRVDQEHHEASSAGAQELAAGRAAVESGLIDLIDMRIGYVARQLALEPPRFVQQGTELAKRLIGVDENVDGALNEGPDGAKLASVAADVANLFVHNVAGATRKPGKEQHDGIAQFGQATRRQNDRRDRKGVVWQKIDPVEAPIRGPQLILATDVLLEDLLFDANRGAAKFALRDYSALKRMEGVDEP